MRKITSLVAAMAIAAAIISLPGRSAAAPVPTAPVAAAVAPASAPALAPTALLTGDGLADAFGNSPMNLLQSLLCPVVTAIADLTDGVPVVGPIVDALPALICSISVLGYVYKTTYLPPSGPPVVRYTKAIAGIPTPLNVDGVGLVPDFYGTIALNLPLNGLNLQIQRQLGFNVNAKVSIEAIAMLPTSGAPTFVGFGEDGTIGGTAGRWVARASVLGLSPSTVDLGLDITTTNAPLKLGVIGEMFSGPDADAPERIYRGNANFSPVPAAFKTRLKLADDRQQVLVNTTPTKLDAKVDILTPGNREQNITATVDQVPSSIDVVHTSGVGDSETVTYDASAPIAKLAGSYRDKVAGNIQTAAALDAWGVPAHIQFDQVDEKTFVGATQGGKFDRIQARFAKGGDVGPLDASTSAFAKFHRTTATALKGSLQLNDLRSVELDQSGPVSGRLIFATAPALIPFNVDDDVSTIHLDGHLKGLPADTTVTLDSEAGEIVFDGHGTGIQEIFIHGTKSTPFFAKATRVDVTVKDLPAVMTVDYKQTNGGVTFTASGNGVGSIELLASNGAGAPAAPADGDYASYEDTGPLYRAYGRVLGIQEVSFNADPMSGTIKTTSPQVLNLYVNLADATHNLKVNGKINKVPSHIDFILDQPTNKTTVLEYDSHGQNIDEVTVHATGLYNLADGSALPLGIDTLHFAVEDIPDHLRAVFSSSNGTSFTFAPRGQNDPPNNQKIGRILLQLYPSASGPHNSVAGHQTAYGNLQTGRFTADIHDIGDTFFQVTDTGQNMGYTIASDPLDYEFVLDDGKFLKGQISNPTPATINLNMSNKVDVHYRAKTDTQINSITLKTDMAGGYIDVNLQNIAPDVKVCFASTSACKASFVPSVFGGFNMPPSIFAFSLIPTNLAGAAWPNRFRVDGTYCFSESDAATCLNGSNEKERLVISNLRFGKVQVGAGFQEFGCTACFAGRAYAYFDTDDTLISGDVKYFEADEDAALVHYHSDSDAAGIQAQNKILFVDYCLPTCIDYDDLTLLHSGTFSCISNPHLDIAVPVFDDVDVLSGSFIHFC